MEGFCQECDRLDDSDRALEESVLKLEEKYASLLVDEDNKDTTNGGDDYSKESDNGNSLCDGRDFSMEEIDDGDDSLPEQNDDGDFLKEEINDGGDSLREENDDDDFPMEEIEDGGDFPWEDNDDGDLPNEEIDDDGDLPHEEIDDDGDYPWGDDFYDDCFLQENENNDGYGYFYDQPQPSAWFERVYCCFPLSSVDKTHMEIGNKIIMPGRALIPLMETQISMPMQFEILNQSTGRVSHCGVLEFTGEEESAVFLPDWMMKNMQLQEGDLLLMKNKNLEKGTYIKLQPHTTDFLGISNPKAVLEANLQKFSCLTMGDTIMISYGSKNFYINVVETKPSAAISIIDADCEVDFAPPLDYKEPEKRAAKSALGKEPVEAIQKPKFKPFTGLARRLDEKPSSMVDSASLPNEQSAIAVLQKNEAAQANPTSSRSPPQDRSQLTSKFQPFTGKKYTLAG